MHIASLAIIVVFSLIWLWLVVVAVFALKYDITLEPFQRMLQILIVLLVPFFGSALILHLVKEHYPNAIPQSLIPWPFKSLVFNKRIPGNKDRDDNEESGIDLAISSEQHSQSEYSGRIDGSNND